MYYYARQYEKAMLSYRMAIELDPRFASAHTDLARALEALGRFDQARAAYETGQRLAGGIAGPSFGLAHLEAAAGNVAEARRMLDELRAAREQRVVSAWGIGALHASLDEIDEAYRWLEIAVQERRRDSACCASILDWIRFDPTRATRRSSVAWASMMARRRIASPSQRVARHCSQFTARAGEGGEYVHIAQVNGPSIYCAPAQAKEGACIESSFLS